jgi:urease accessory protein UreE
VSTSEVRRGNRVLLRLDALNDASDQSILVWEDTDVVRAVLVADSVSQVSSRADHERRVLEALTAAGV